MINQSFILYIYFLCSWCYMVCRALKKTTTCVLINDYVKKSISVKQPLTLLSIIALIIISFNSSRSTWADTRHMQFNIIWSSLSQFDRQHFSLDHQPDIQDPHLYHFLHSSSAFYLYFSTMDEHCCCMLHYKWSQL